MNNSLASSKLKQILIIDQILIEVILTINFTILTEAIGIVGIVGNVINILNFRKQGYKDGFNVTLTALAVSDLGMLITHQVILQIYNPWLDESSLVMLKPHILLFVIYVNDFFNRVSGFVTACAAFERCLCVVLPMKVKLLMTRRVATVVNISIFVALIAYVILPNSLVYVGSKYLPNFNRTFAYVYYTENREAVMNIYYLVNALFFPNLTMLMLMVFTLILITKLKSNSEWRHRVSNPQSRGKSSVNYKERNAIAMLATMSGIYIVCLIPCSALNLADGLFEEMKVGGIYFDLNKLVYSFLILFEAINCSVNSIIYFKMSSKYRQVFYQMCIWWNKK
ncbi:neuropeptides capa receptor [Biomphalaria glabrata]|nr:neuropeptides capa receptor-like [Biomphalaria glabrata]